MKTEHTPGPWFADANGCIWRRDPRELYENGGGVAGDRPLASAHVGWAGEGLTGYQMEANARLIAAAPEMLEALRELLATTLLQMPPFEAGKEAQDAWADRCAEARNNASFVIYKATGGQA